MTDSQIVFAILMTPLLSAVIIACFLRRHGTLASIISVAAAAGICVFTYMAIIRSGGNAILASANWLELGDFTVSMGFFFDGVSMTMLTMVAFVGFLIHFFSLGYMAKDNARGRFFGGMSSVRVL